MLSTQVPAKPDVSTPRDRKDPLALYTRSLHDYTLRLWSESRRLAEENARAQETVQQTQQPDIPQTKAASY